MERREEIGGIAIAVFVACILLFYPLILGNSDTAKNVFNSTHTFRYSIIAFVPNFIVGSVRGCSSKHSERPKQRHKIQSKGTKISIFAGRGANKNQAIFEILDAKGPLPISDLQKILNKQKGLEITYYASLNKRIHALEKDGYVAQARPAAPNRGCFKAALYEARAKFYLACFLNSNSGEEILSKLTDTHATIILSDLVNATVSTKEN
jgi:hypothetical protein